jgi:acyl-coenzyme A thioesterase PaaI-like protein
VPAPEGVDLVFPEDGGCFGCSPSNPAGLALRFRRVGARIVAPYAIADRFHGAPGVAHGGVVAAILDEVSCAAAVFLRDRYVVTGELVVRYERPVPVEVPLVIEAEIAREGHLRYTEIEARVLQGGVRLARSTGKFFHQTRGTAAP